MRELVVDFNSRSETVLADAIPDLAPQQVSDARRVVAAHSSGAEECLALLDALGIGRGWRPRAD